MAELYPDDADLLAMTADPATGVEYIQTGKAPYYLEFRRMLHRVLLNLAPLGLRVYAAGPLAVRVKPGCYWLGGQLRQFPGTGQDLALADDDTNYIYLDSDNTARAVTGATGWPSGEHLRLASVATAGGSFDPEDIVDLRGWSLFSSLGGLAASVGEINQAVDGVSANVTAANLNVLTGGGQTGLHSHAVGAHQHPGGDITSAVASAANADTVDGSHASAFAAAGHNHDAAYAPATHGNSSHSPAMCRWRGNWAETDPPDPQPGDMVYRTDMELVQIYVIINEMGYWLSLGPNET